MFVDTLRLAPGLTCAIHHADRIAWPQAIEANLIETGESSIDLEFSECPSSTRIPLSKLGPDGAFGEYGLSPDNKQLVVLGDPSAPETLRAALHVACSVAAQNAGRILLHGAGIVWKDSFCLIALADSGGGKSTLTNLVSGTILSDEAVVMGRAADGLISISSSIFQSSTKKQPTFSSHRLAGILLLNKSVHPSFTPASPWEVLRELARQTFGIPQQVPSQARIQSLKTISEQTKAFHFNFPNSDLANQLYVQLVESEIVGANS